MTKFPLRLSAHRRYLEDQDGTPFFYHADTAWRMAQRLSIADVAHYLDDRVERGFNAIHVHAINKEKEGPLNPEGEHPFQPPHDLTRPNERYWRRLDAVLDAITERGLLIVVSAAWFGYGGAGWRAELTPETAEVYGRFLGNRYKHLPNVIWVQGGDNDPGDKALAARALAEAIREAAPHHLHTFHAAAEHPSSHFFHDAPWLDINLAYTYKEAYKQVLAEYNRPAPIRPIILGETGYEGEGNTGFPWTTQLVRQQPYWALLSGAAGHAHGSATVWHFGADWQSALHLPALRQMEHVKSLFAPRAWHTLVPDQDHKLVTAGYEEGATYAAAACAYDGAFALIYVPTHRTITVDLSRLHAPVTARWYDPTNGAYTAAFDSSLPNQGSSKFTSPSRNSTGEHDFVLVLET